MKMLFALLTLTLAGTAALAGPSATTTGAPAPGRSRTRGQAAMNRKNPKAPLVIAHRGASAAAPENTLAAFRLARTLRADGIELDTQLSRDGVPIVMHDDSVDRTTNGTGPVSGKTLAELKRLDAGAWKGARFTGEHIPTLEDVFREANDFTQINVELKVGGGDVGPLVEKVAALIRRYHLEKRVIISSFGAEALEKMHAAMPEIPTGYLYGEQRPERQPAGLAAQHPHFKAVTPAYMAWARGLGQDVNAWTVDDPAEMRRLAGLGVASIITNVPDVLRRELSRP